MDKEINNIKEDILSILSSFDYIKFKNISYDSFDIIPNRLLGSTMDKISKYCSANNLGYNIHKSGINIYRR